MCDLSGMSHIALELDRALQSLDEATSASLTNLVRDAISLVTCVPPLPAAQLPSNQVSDWLQRLEYRGAQVSTGRLGAPLQAVMDDLRS